MQTRDSHSVGYPCPLLTPPSRARSSHSPMVGFTLIELMITVAIIGILATIAMPRLYRHQLNARRSEVFVNTQSLAMAEQSYFQEFDTFIATTSSPSTPLNGQLYPFNPNLSNWRLLEWQPDGLVRCHYFVKGYPNNAAPTWVRPTGLCDLDDDGVEATWWVDVDPLSMSSSSQHMILRPNTSTSTLNSY